MKIARVQINEKGIINRANREFFNLTCYSKNDITESLSLYRLFKKSDAENILRSLLDKDDGINARPFVYCLRCRHKKIKKVLVYAAGNRGYDLCLVEVNDKDSCGRRTYEAERKFKLIFEFANDAMFLMYEDRFVEYNAKAIQFYGGDIKYIINHTPYDCSPAYQPDGAPSKEKALSKIKAALSGEPQFFEWQHQRSDGSTFNAEISLTRIESGRDYPFVLSIVRDITERKRNEEKIQEYQRHLEKLVQERTDALMQANVLLKAEIKERKKAEKRVKELYRQEKQHRRMLADELANREVFTRGWVHELKTPLASLIGCSELMLKTENGEINSRLAKQVYVSGIELSKRISEVFDFVKVTTGSISINPSYFNLVDVINDMAESLSIKAEEKGLRLRVETGEQFIGINADLERIKQVLLNLLDNSFKFTSSGGTITIKASVDSDSATTSVIDTGVGIPKERLKNIYKPYFGQHKDDKYTKGLGIGLALCRNIIHLHGGKIEVESVEGDGCQVVFSLPLAAYN